MAKNEYYKKSSVKVVNPYTFVPINPKGINGDKRSKRQSADSYYQERGELHTGVLHCRLEVVTPLAIPDTSNFDGENDEHKTYHFYQDKNGYAIPGSSIRGVIRSVYETVTDSCFSTVKTESFLNLRASQREAYRPGILIKEDGKFKLYSAKRYMVPIKGYQGIKGLKLYYFEQTIDKNKMRAIRYNKNVMTTGDWVKFTVSKEKYSPKGRKIWEGIVSELYPSRENAAGNVGMLYIGEPFSKKHGESVFAKGKRVKDKNGNDISSNSLEKAFSNLKETSKIYRDTAINKMYQENGGIKTHRGYQGFEKLSPENGIPLWYSYDETKNTISFSFASIGRIFYQNNLNNLLGELDRCKSRTSLCEACLLFGMAGSKKTDKSMGSRVRITDAHVDGKALLKKDVLLKELGTPRYSYLPFYAKYDNNGQVVPKSYDHPGVGISGRKYYWHNKYANDEPLTYTYKDNTDNADSTDYETKRNVTMDLIKSGTQFTFDVYYDEIRAEQLEKLVWVLTIGQNNLPKDLENQETLYCHKLGRGKPLGLGSVKIVVEENCERIFVKEEYSLKKTEKSDIKIMEWSGESIKAIKKVSSMEYPLTYENSDASIDYPNILNKNEHKIDISWQQGNNDVARHQWYTQNREFIMRDSKNKKNSKETSFDNRGQSLPGIMDKDQYLHNLYFTKFIAKVKQKNKVDSDKCGYDEYNIIIDDEPEFKNKNCVLHVRTGKKLDYGKIISVELENGDLAEPVFKLLY